MFTNNQGVPVSQAIQFRKDIFLNFNATNVFYRIIKVISIIVFIVPLFCISVVEMIAMPIIQLLFHIIAKLVSPLLFINIFYTI